jgi:hypothetical protein
MTLEEKKDRLNLELRMTLSILDMIDGVDRVYPNYCSDSNISEDEYIEQQLLLASEIRDRLINVFKD